MPRAIRWLGWMAFSLAACGEIRVASDDASAMADSVGDGSLADAVDLDGDATSSDAPGGCQSDDECKGTKGKTPCKYPVCDKASGLCKLHARAVGELCVDPAITSAACQESRCDGSGKCLAQAQVDGTVCGVGVCGNVCKSGGCVPATAADYDDQNPCTNDYCDQGKVVAHDPITNLTLSCDDKNLCTQNDVCVAGVCQGAPIGCSDGLDCTLDTCTQNGGCQHTPKLDACSDGNPCTTDACELAVGCTVVGFEIGACDDGNACSAPDLCDKGACKGKPSSDPSCACTSDSDCVGKAKDLCSVKYKCDEQVGVCVPKPDSAVVCDTSKDGTCQQTACDVTVGSCVTLPVAGSPTCDDGNACTQASHCAGGACVGSVLANCSDQNPCTVDSCAGDIGCFHAPASGTCDDGNPCTVNDSCHSGGCAGSKKPCDDGLLCTFDSCDAKSGDCLHVAETVACDDQNPCTTDTCDVTADCQHVPNDAAPCDDNNVCTDDTCKGGKCVSVVKCDCMADSDCDDKNPCTVDACTAGKCVAKPDDGKPCSPSDKCQKPDSGTCGGGACVAGNAPVDCSSAGDACNAGICDPASGKCQTVARPSGTACEDGDGCTLNDVCEGGKCIAGTPFVCSPPAGLPCQNATCQSTGVDSHACALSDKPTGTTCDDGLFCTIGEQCDANGQCTGTPFPCSSPSVCVIAACSESQKACVATNASATQACDDGLFCTVGDSCDGQGNCAAGPPRVCANGVCLTGVCDEPTDQCLSEPIAECCTAGMSCDDGFPCTADACQGKSCSHVLDTGCCQTTFWSDSFDGGSLQGVTVANSSGSPVLGWQLRTGGNFTSASSALYYGNVATDNFDFGTSSGTASTPTMDLPFYLFATGTLSFSVWFDTEGGNAYDVLTVSAAVTGSTGAVTTTILWTKPQTVKMGIWQKQSVKLPPSFWGQSVRFQFAFNTVDSLANTGHGVYIDDISVQIPCL